MKRKSLEHTQTTTTTTTVQAHEDYDGGLTELQKSIIREQQQQQQQQHEVPPWYVEEEQMFLQQEDAYFENQRRLENSRPKLAVIICDDNEVNLKILTRLFSKVFFREVKVIQCRDGLEAIEAYKSMNANADNSHDRLAMIVMDFQMPKCDGLSACKYIRAMEKFKQEEENAMMNQPKRLPFEQKYFEKVPILMFTTEFHMIVPALIEGIVDDRLAKPCSCKDFILTVHKHMPNFIFDEYADMLVPLGENALLKRKYSSEACLSGMLLEGSSNLDSDVSAMSTDNGVLEQTKRKGSGSSNNKNTKNTGKEDVCFYDVAEGDIFAEEDDDDDNDNDDDIQHKQNMEEAKKNARWNLFSFSPKRKGRKVQTKEKTEDDVRVDGNNTTYKRMKRQRGNNNSTIIPSSGFTGGKKRLSLDSYIRAARKVWTQTKSRLGGINNRSNGKEKQTRAFVVVKNNAATPELSTLDLTTRDNLQYYQPSRRNGTACIYDTM